MTANANNFDLLRLAAALQVAVSHSFGHLGLQSLELTIPHIVEAFPGVPIFFFISGFLISRSFERNPRLGEFVRNRLLRIYPGLIACFFVSLAAVAFVGHFARTEFSAAGFLTWVAAQLSFVQFYNPDFMRAYGVGVLNGSLWTIPVELQFYMLVPLFYALAPRKSSAQRVNYALLALILIFLIINRLHVHAASYASDTLWHRLVGVSFAPWFYMFLVGVLFQKNFDLLNRWFGGRFIPVVLLYAVIALGANAFFGWGFGNAMGPVLFIALSIVVFSAAFTRPELSDRLLRRNDISYGVYIYHMPVVNFLLVTGVRGTPASLLAAMGATLFFSALSWRWVEKPALSFKRHALYRHDKTGG